MNLFWNILLPVIIVTLSVAYSNERKLPPDDEADLVSRTSQRQLLNLKKAQYQQQQQSPVTRSKQPKLKKQQASKKSLRPRFEQAFSLVDNKQQNDVKRRLNKTVRTRSKASQHHHVAATAAAAAAAVARSQFARVKKNSLTRNFYNTIGVRNNCTRQVCFPPIGNLLIGRRNFLFASSTCGLENAERFCILGDSYSPVYQDPLFMLIENEVEKRSRCLVCDSRESYSSNRNSHRIENVINARKQTNEELATKWWQSENGVENVFIQFDLESEFILAHIYMLFKSFPPAAMIFEKSSDYGVSWQPIAYFASSCDEFFPDVPKRSEYLTTPICVSKYSQRDGTSNRELIYRPLYRYRYLDPYLLTKHLKITNLRFNLTKQHMLGDNYFPDSEDVFLKYYYAIKEIQIIGTCFCNGHSSQCERDLNVHYDVDNVNRMIHSKCVCQHYTTGNNCQKCLPMYNNRPWRPAEYGEANECELCECNGHASSCAFDEKLYMANGNRNGGVCACQHNTEGPNCERCKKDYYHDKNLPFHHPDACKPCKCFALGTLSGERICTEKSCICKKFVTGSRCDTCMDGYWDLSEKHGDNGCKKCECVAEGTVNNKGCDKRTGLCFECKQHVEGKRCGKCKPGYFGLNALLDVGCEECNCAPGFSHSSECNRETGKCSCKPNFHGPKCNTIGEGFYCARVDHIVYEAEDAIETTSLSQISEKYDPENVSDDPYEEDDPVDDSHVTADNTARRRAWTRWTGIGYMRVFEGSHLKFRFMHAYNTGIFDLVVRYESQDNWETVFVKVANLGPENYRTKDRTMPVKHCGELRPEQRRVEQIGARLYKMKTSSTVYFGYCFEQFHSYEVELFFNRRTGRRQRSIYNSAREMPSILVDSLVVIPSVDYLINKTLNNADLAEKLWEAKECLDDYVGLPQRPSVQCDLAFCVVTNEFFGLLPCECDPMGSFSNNCAQIGGECLCKPNVVGQKCNKCKQTTWGFSSKGCQPCNCDYGSKTNQCDVKTGQCDCYDNHAGKTCGECALGHYNPPQCQRCECNDLSDTCTHDGICNACRYNTAGAHCERCKQGFYGAPLYGIPCKPCACPGVNGNNFAIDCVLNDATGAFKCNCRKGYTGERCDKCDAMYYGNPLQPMGLCKRCQCNDNVDRNDPNACDSNTGQCNNCLYNTYGFNCEKCQVGYYGNALAHDCKKCNCNQYGTDLTVAESCDNQFGHCTCLPNVIGILCDECAENYWNLESGKGCQFCDCDTAGTVENSTSCDQKSGQCNCIRNRGGRTCRDCPFGYWGSPRTGCRKCNCNIPGSQSAQCDSHDGHCICLSGITGYNCDQCARGTYGRAPSCTKCGECFDNWDETVGHLNERLEKLEKRAINIHASLGRANLSANLSDFYTQYDKMRFKITDIAHIVGFNKSTEKGLPRLNARLNTIKIHAQNMLEGFDRAKEIISRWTINDTMMSTHRENYNKVYNQTMHLLRISISLSESFVNGAQLSIRMSYNTSNEASELAEKINEQLEKKFKPILDEIKDKLGKAQKKTEADQMVLKEFSRKNTKEKRNVEHDFEQTLALLDSAICGGPALIKPDCSHKCGSVKCGTCGYFNPNTTTSSDLKVSLGDEDGEECSKGLQWSYLRLVNAIESFKRAYQEKESLLKTDLSKMNTEKMTSKKLDDDTNLLKQKVNTTIESVNMQSNLINSLLSTAFNYSDRYINMRQKLETDCVKMVEEFNNTDLEKQNQELLANISLISAKSQELKEKIEKEKSQATIPAMPVFEIDANLTSFERIDELKNLTSLAANVTLMVDTNQELLENLTRFNTEVHENQEKIKSTLEQVKMNMDGLGQKDSLFETALNSREIDFAQSKTSYGILEYKVNEIKARIGNADAKLASMSIEVEKLMNRLKSESGQDGDDESFLLQIVRLKEEILKKEKNLKDKTIKLNEFQAKNLETNNKIKSLREEIDQLTSKTRKLKQDLTEKSNFFNSCK